MNRIARPATAVVSILLAGAAVTACSSHVTTGQVPAVAGSTASHAAPKVAATHAAQNPSSLEAVCTAIQKDLTTAISDLQVSQFDNWSADFTAGYMIDGGFMTSNTSEISESMGTVSVLMSELSRDSSVNLAVRTVGGDLSDTGADFDDLLSGDSGTTGDESDEIAIVHGLSSAVADAVKVCGPSPYTRYAPAQEQARDYIGLSDPSGFSGTFGNEIGVLNGIVGQDKTSLANEEKDDALGPNGNGGDCTVSLQMNNFAEDIGADLDQFSERSRLFAEDISQENGFVQKLKAAVSTIRQQRLTVPAGAEQVIAEAETADSHAAASINSDIDAENSMAQEAYSMADAMAREPSTLYSENDVLNCGSGPGQYMALSHIS